ncbi:MAG: hypothetical protein JNM62_09240 [Flavobacteriales bacterium]|nr:hypothetical protein [Flavobacteriales bacterium]
MNDPRDEAGLLLSDIGPSTVHVVYDRFASVLYGAALRMTGNEKQAATIVATVFIAIQRPEQRYTPDQGRPLIWLLRQVHAAGCAVLAKGTDAAHHDPATSDRDLHLLLHCFALVQHAPEGTDRTEGPVEKRMRLKSLTRYSPR